MKRRSDQNPFVVRRWEFENDHVVWVPGTAARILGQNPCHIQGVRGSGKTALLRLADYYTRRSSNMRILNSNDAINRCLGVYINFIDEFTEHFENETQPQRYYNYTILYCLGKTLDLIDDAARDGILTFERSSEVEIVSRLVKRFEIKADRFEFVKSFTSLASFLRRHCRQLRTMALLGEYPAGYDQNDIDGFEFMDELCSQLRQRCILSSPSGHHFIKICIDDAHLAGKATQSRLNNILYRSQAPIFWNIAFVEGQFDPFDVDNRMELITSHDRALVDLNYREMNSEFEEICSRVFQIRAEKYLSATPNQKGAAGGSELRKYIGRTRFDSVFDRFFARTRKEQIVEQVKIFQLSLTARLGENAKLYQAFLASCIFKSVEEFEIFLGRKKDSQIDNYFRQKISAALVVGARRLDLSVPYEGINALLYFSDGCLRDFLLFCAELFELDQERNSRTKVFFSAELISTEMQSTAFRRCAEGFSNGLHDPRQPYARQMPKLIEGLGRLMYLLQSEDYRSAALLPDRGLFRVDFETEQARLFSDLDPESALLIRKVLKQAVYAGALRLEEGNLDKGSTVVVRIAGILIPSLMVAPRKPLREVTISWISIQQLLALPSSNETHAWAEHIFNQINKAPISIDPSEQVQGVLL